MTIRIDKIKRKKQNSNIIDFNLKKLVIKYDNSEEEIDHCSWKIKSKTVGQRHINIDYMVDYKYFKEQISILKDFRYFLHCQKIILSHQTLISQVIYFRHFLTFINNSNVKIYKIEDIDYNMLLLYSDFLKSELDSKSKYNNLISVLKSISKIKQIKVHNDILNKNLPTISFSDDVKKIIPYTKEEFQGIAKTIMNIINDYFYSDILIPRPLFIKAAYWMFAISTGFNQKGIDSLEEDSFSIINENNKNKIYLVITDKNRSKKGYQNCNINLIKNNNEIHIFEKTLQECISINREVRKHIADKDKNSLFIHFKHVFNGKAILNKGENKELTLKYNGSNSSFVHNHIYQSYALKHGVSGLNLSTLKIRNQWSNEMFDLSKSEQLVSKMLNHQNLKTTNTHYIKTNITEEIQIKFSLIQNLLYSFSQNKQFTDWIKFQKAFDIKEENIKDLILNIQNGKYETSLGKCFNKNIEGNNICESYFNCFSCKNYSIVCDKDLWKIMSFRESLLEETLHTKNYQKIYKHIVETIDSIISTLDKDLILNARSLLRKNRHPFWKNQIMIKTLIEKHEEIL